MNKVKIFFCLFLFIMSFVYAKNIANNINIFSYISSDYKQTPLVKNIIEKRVKNPISFLDMKDKTLVLKEEKQKEKKVNYTNTKTKKPTIYIFNTHQTEEYAKNAYNITPTVVTVSNILKDELNELGLSSIVETKDVIKEVNKRGYDYSGTYTVSFEYLQLRKKNNNSLEYYFDMHRDSVTGSAARTKINGKKYATIMFLIGANHDNYKKNLKNVKIMEKYLKENYPGLVRETFIQRQWTYNQWYSPKMFLVELGGPDNTLEEVYNTTKALAKSIEYYIKEEK